MPAVKRTRPTQAQVRVTTEVVRWYLARYYRIAEEPGSPTMFCEPKRVGAFAVSPASIQRGDGNALFRLLIATTMFQRLQDVLVLKILREMEPAAVREVTNPATLLAMVDTGTCELLRSTNALRERCDLSKDPATRVGCCDANQHTDCHLKRHTVWLKRYGHFGKVPTSAALTLREAGVRDLQGLRDAVMKRFKDPRERAVALEQRLCASWRVNQKIASMFLSALTNPDLSIGCAPWSRGVDWTYYVVVDSNVDLFLQSVGYAGTRTYDARREFIRSLAEAIDLSSLRSGLQPYNPRLVQQAMYLFMSVSNRRSSSADCMHLGESECRGCPKKLAARCPAQRHVGRPR